jgi:hypothetical protein
MLIALYTYLYICIKYSITSFNCSDNLESIFLEAGIAQTLK